MFEITNTDNKARTGILNTKTTKVKTPFFMPVASKGAIKALDSRFLEEELKYESLISNSFMLSLSPGIKEIKELGGIHKFMNFKKNIFTDSGGFQVLSEKFLVKKTHQGVIFKSNKGKQKYTPEIAIENQLSIDSDVAMTLDDVAHYDMNAKDYVEAIKRTHNWSKRALDHHNKLKKEYNSKQLLFGICQGGIDPYYRKFSTHKINQMDFDGVALGGLVIGESRNELINTIDLSIQHFDEHKIKYLMGLGSPPDIIKAIRLGVDCFDSIYPTSNARHGSLITKFGRINIKKTKYKLDTQPIENDCKCFTCKNYSKGYLHHLIKNKELLGYRLATIHNLYFMKNLVKNAQDAIKKQNYDEFADDFLEKYFSQNEKKEFSSNIKNKYMTIKEQNRKILYLTYRRQTFE